MTDELIQEDGNADLWRTIFADGHPELKKQHTTHLAVPKAPRCRLCFVPFHGIGGWWYVLLGSLAGSVAGGFLDD